MGCGAKVGEQFGFSVFRCKTNYERGNYEDFLRATWIRPEDMVRYEPHVDVVKIATRRHPDPVKVLEAYAMNSYHGNLADLMDPAHRFPKGFDNDSFGKSLVWPDVLTCREANNCRHCGKCTALMDDVYICSEQIYASCGTENNRERYGEKHQ